MALVLALLTISTSLPLAAFEVTPLVHQLSPLGRNTSSTLRVINPSPQTLTLEFEVRELLLGPDGARAGRATDEELLVFPPAASVPPGGTQAARIQWLGDPELDRARSYFLVVRQLPVASEEDRRDATGVQVLLTFNAVVHVTPPGARARLGAREPRLDEALEPTLVVELENRGRANAYGSLLSLDVSDGTRRHRFSPTALERQLPDLFFPPGHVREIRLRLPEGRWRTPLTVDVDYAEPVR